MKGSIEKKFEEIDKKFDKIAERNKDDLENAKIKPINDKFPFAQNGITAMIASMGSGKTYTYLKLISQQEVLNDDEPFFELVCICSTSSKFDKTVLTFKEAIKKSKLVCVKDSDLLDWLNEYIERMHKYNLIMKYVLNGFNDNDIDDELHELFIKNKALTKKKRLEWITNILVHYGWHTYPHRCLLILDDFASHPLLRSKETELSRLLKKLRHFNITVLLCVQTVKSLPKDIKRTVSDVVLFPGISEEDFDNLMKEINAGFVNRKDLYNIYKKIKDQHANLRLHLAAKRILMNSSKKSMNDKINEAMEKLMS